MKDREWKSIDLKETKQLQQTKREFHFPLTFFSSSNHSQFQSSSAQLNKIILSYLTYSDLNFLINSKIANDTYSWEKAAQGFLLKNGYLDQAWLLLYRKLEEHNLLPEIKLEQPAIEDVLEKQILANNEKSIHAATLLPQLNEKRAYKLFGDAFLKAELNKSIQEALIQDTESYNNFYFSNFEFNVRAYPHCTNWNCITAIFCCFMTDSDGSCCCGATFPERVIQIPLTPLLHVALKDDQQKLEKIINFSSKLQIDQAKNKLTELLNKEIREVEIRSEQVITRYGSEGRNWLTEALSRIMTTSYQLKKDSKFLTIEFFTEKIKVIGFEFTKLQTISDILKYYNTCKIFSLQQRDALLLFKKNSYIPEMISLIENIQEKIVSLIQTLKNDPISHSDLLEEVIKHDLFDKRHFERGVKKIYLEWIENQFKEVQAVLTLETPLLKTFR